MKIDQDACIVCKECIDCCPARAIMHDDSQVYIDEDLCFECGNCRRIGLCPVDAFIESEQVTEYPRVVRPFFSDPNTTHKLTLVPGRGTEESKTNDVTGRVKRGEVGICIEFGRPGIGCSFKDISQMTRALRLYNVKIEKNNPLTALMDPETGNFDSELLNQRVLSAIIEIKLDKIIDLEQVIPIIIETGRKIDTVFSLSFVSRFTEDGELPILDNLVELGLNYAPNAKVNLGLGKPLCEL